MEVLAHGEGYRGGGALRYDFDAPSGAMNPIRLMGRNARCAHRRQRSWRYRLAKFHCEHE